MLASISFHFQGHHLTFQLTLTVLLVTQGHGAWCPTRDWPSNSVRLGFISPKFGDYGFYSSAAAFTVAIEKAQRDGYLVDKNVTIHWQNGACAGRIALGGTVTLRDEADMDAMIGLPCSEASINAGKLLAQWNIPHFAYSSPDPILIDRKVYSTLVRFISPFNMLAEAVSDLFHYYEWKKAVMLTGPQLPDDFCDFSSRAVESKFAEDGITVAERIKIPESYPVSEINGYLQMIKNNGRIVIMCCKEWYLREIMLEAHAEGMTSGDYVFMTTNLLPVDDVATRWINNSQTNNDDARLAFQPLIQVAQGVSSGNQAEEFRQELPYRMAEPPWNTNITLELGLIGSVFSLYLHDAVYLYMMCADEAVKKGSTVRNGTMLLDLAKEKVFEGLTGKVSFDENADRISDFWVWHLERNGKQYIQMAEINVTVPVGNRVSILSERYWGQGTGYNAPPDEPLCGFFNERCQETGGRNMVITVVSVVLVVFALVICIGIFVYRRRKYELGLESMVWKVAYNDIHLLGGRTKEENGSTRSFGEVSKYSSSIGKSAATMGSDASDEAALRQAGLSGSIELGNYKGMLVIIKKISKAGVLLTRNDYIELKAMKDLSHENVNVFVGLCLDAPQVSLLDKYCPKGSLQDILENVNIKLDMMFKSSLLNDLIAGMEYIHKSPIRVHGRLKSSNCVIDGRWVLKITDFGLVKLREVPEGEDARWNALLWTAPEVLRDPNYPLTAKQDVYSFSIILSEIIYRAPPYEAGADLMMVKKDLLGRIRNGETPPFRPELPPVAASENVDDRLLGLIEECWNEDVSHRPDSVTVRSRYSAINKGKKFNIMDNMIRMLENYANNLEEVVNERTKQLSEEKKKTDLLLYRMLPSTVADALKVGETVPPEIFSAASVYFSDIVSFTEMSSVSSPFEIVDFLNDLWTVFDDIISKHDVYKVETIGDAYMVVSGVPVRCQTHAVEISDMALDIMASVMVFKIRHRPEKQLRIRIGLHSGSVAAGVVGVSMPRYCLFGDTVNMASRMESTGKPQHIQISQSTAFDLETKGGYFFEERGYVEVKGKGKQKTFWLTGRQGFPHTLPSTHD